MPLYLGKNLVSGAGIGKSGEAGAPGKSAYQSAMEAGYDGTEIAFNAALAETPGHIVNKENPHGVTAKQVGLGNVPNVSTNDQTPTYSEANELSTLTSGEKLSVAFGKIAKAISSFLSHAHRHAADGEDPLTPEMIGAVNIAGDTMTGKFGIQTNGSPYALSMYTEAGGVANIGVMRPDGVYTILQFLPDGADTHSLQYASNKTGAWQAMRILHTGNTNRTTLVSTETTPTVNNEINWTYE